MTLDEFISIWNQSDSAESVANAVGRTRHSVKIQASRLRKQGHSLKYMPTQKTEPIETRFWSMVLKSETCWLWKGSVNRKGYGQISTKRGSRPLQTHRLSYELHVGPIPEGKMVLHKCDNPRCVRPDHLFLGTAKENTADMMQKERGHWQKNSPRHKASASLALADL